MNSMILFTERMVFVDSNDIPISNEEFFDAHDSLYVIQFLIKFNLL